MFGERPEVKPEELDSEAIKEMQSDACKAEEEAAKKKGRPVVTDKTIMVLRLPIAPEFGTDPNYLPELVTVREWSKSKNKKVNKLYYQCKVCQHEAQNRASMLTQTRRCLKIFLQCKICGKLYQGVGYLDEHI